MQDTVTTRGRRMTEYRRFHIGDDPVVRGSLDEKRLVDDLASPLFPRRETRHVWAIPAPMFRERRFARLLGTGFPDGVLGLGNGFPNIVDGSILHLASIGETRT